MPRVSVKGPATKALKQDAAQRLSLVGGTGQPLVDAPSTTKDSFTNFAHKMGMGADNPLSGASYGFNPISRNRTLLEWIHRGSWLGGIAVDVIADDMTRAGIEYVTELPPEVSEALDHEALALNIWYEVGEAIRWGRLYGGAISVVLIDGQDMRTPLRPDTIAPGQFKGMMTLDRWMVEPSLEDLVTDIGPHLGLPRFYRVTQAAPALRGLAIHHSRVAVRHVGIALPYQQRLMENLWGISVIERMYDRMVAFDSASTGAAQLVYKAYLRTLTVDGLRDIVAAGGPALEGLTSYMDIVRRYQSMEGITLIDGTDKFEIQGHQAFSGLSDVLNQFGQQISGALQIPLVRMFGQSPSGLNSSGESDVRTYYDNIRQRQMRDLYHGVTLIYKLIAKSKGVQLPPNFAINFKSLWELSDKDKNDIAKTNAETVSGAVADGTIGRQTALKELRQMSRQTGVFTNITTEMINAADDSTEPPIDDSAMQTLMAANGAPNEAGPNGQEGAVDKSPRRRISVPQPAPAGGQADRVPGQRPGA